MSFQSPKHWLLFILLLNSPKANAQEVRDVVLASSPIPISVSTSNLTTVQFPAPIETVDAARMSQDPTPPNTFFMTIGETSLSVRALTKGAKDNANVQVDGRYYVLMFSEDTLNPTFLLRLHNPTPVSVKSSSQSGPFSLTDHFALLDTAKAYRNLKRLRPDVLRDVQHAPRALTMLYGDVRITIVELWKFEQEGALVVHCLIENPTKTELRYDPKSFTLKVHNKLYPQDLSDGNGIMSAQSTNRVFFTVAHDSEGGPANLSVHDDVVLLFARQKAPMPVDPKPIYRPQTSKLRSRP